MEFVPAFPQFIKDHDLQPVQIYNCDETALFYRTLPDRTLALPSEKSCSNKGCKTIKDRVNLLFACNWTVDHKLPPLMVGKYQNPRCFHNINRSKLPVIYDHSKNAWMTGTIFKSWFHDHFAPAVRKHLRKHRLPEKAVLLLDNCPAHPPADTLRSKDIFVHYLPKNTTSKIQPLDQGIIHAFKDHYRAALTKSFLHTGSSQVESFLKHYYLKDAIYNIDIAMY